MSEIPRGLADMFGFEDDGGFDTPPIPGSRREVIDGRTVTIATDPKSYHVASPDAITGAKLSAYSTILVKTAAKMDVAEADIRRLNMNDGEEREFYEQVLGAAYHEMLDDGVSWQHFQALGQYGFVFFAASREKADEMAAKGAFSGKEMAPTNRAGRRATGAGRPTRTASTGTRSPRKKTS
jgi:hypothetical protein